MTRDIIFIFLAVQFVCNFFSNSSFFFFWGGGGVVGERNCILIIWFLCLYFHCMQVISLLAYLVYLIDTYKQSWLRHAWGFDSELSFYYICGKILST